MNAIITNWPLAFVCVAMIVAAVIDGWKLKVPNWLTFPLVLSGWLLGVLHNFNLLSGTGEGGIGGVPLGQARFLGMAVLYPVYVIGGMGAGDVKMQMGFGSWIGAFYGHGRARNPSRRPVDHGLRFWAPGRSASRSWSAASSLSA